MPGRSRARRPCRLVFEEDDPGAERLCFDEVQGRFVAAVEEALAAPQGNRINEETQEIHEVVLQQRAGESSAAANQDVLPGLLLEPGYLLRGVSFDQVGV